MRRPSARLAVLATFAAAAATATTIFVPALTASGLPSAAEILALAASAQRRLAELAHQGYARSPEMMLGLAIAATLPLLAVASAVTRAVIRWHRRRDRMHRLTLSANSRAAVEPSGRAWLQFDGAAGQCDLLGNRELFRIGRDGDNEVPVDHQSVDLVHALIRRMPNAGYLIVDVSRTGSGVTVNGNPTASCALRDGDRIGLGAFAVTFRRTEQWHFSPGGTDSGIKFEPPRASH